MSTIISRFAPSPTGYLHIGGIRIAMLNYIVTTQAKINYPDSKFLLRIEDTDKIRSNKKYLDSIITGLEWLEIKWDNEIHFQSKKIKRHQEIANKLIDNGKAYKCICEPSKLENQRKENLKKNLSIKRLCNNCENDKQIQSLKNNYSIRIKIPIEGMTSINDGIQGEIKINNKEIDNFIILRSDGTPTYMLAVVVDDYDMKVNTIIRGNDHLNNTFRQFHLYKQLEWELPKYTHIPLILGSDKLKLSKRHGAVDINEFKEFGYLPESIINNLILLGWSPKNHKNEIIEINENINKFKIKKLSKSSSIFDYKKLDFLNNYYLQKDKNFKVFEKYLKKSKVSNLYINANKEKLKLIYEFHKIKVKRLFEFIEIIKIYFDNKFETQPSEILDNNFIILLKNFLKNIIKIENWNKKELDNCINSFLELENIKFANFAMPLRQLLTNNKNGISISIIMLILGKEDTILRINNYIK